MEFLLFVALAALIAIAAMPLVEALAIRAFDIKEVRERLMGQHQPSAPTVRPEPVASVVQPSIPESAMAARLRDLSITFDGRDYRYQGYRYERRDDAIAYAVLVHAKTLLLMGPPAAALGPPQTGIRHE